MCASMDKSFLAAVLLQRLRAHLSVYGLRRLSRHCSMGSLHIGFIFKYNNAKFDTSAQLVDSARAQVRCWLQE